MKSFTRLYSRLDETTKTKNKVEALVSYFESAEPLDAAWAIYFLSGRKSIPELKRVVKSSLLRSWAASAAGLSDWMFEECYDTVGDLAETIALVLPESGLAIEEPLHLVVEKRLLSLKELEEDAQRLSVLETWSQMDARQRFIYNKLLTGAFRVGVSQKLVTRAIAAVSGLESNVIAHRLMGTWRPTAEFYDALVSPDTMDADSSKPYPFYLAHPLDSELAELGSCDEWCAEWKWDGIRAQLIRREGGTYIWSRGEELVSEQFPEILKSASNLPDGLVLDGEIICYEDDQVLPFSTLQKRLGRKKVGPKILSEAPVVMIVYDLLEHGGEDCRVMPLHQRKELLTGVLTSNFLKANFIFSPIVEFENWEDLALKRKTSRERRVEGLMLKRLDSEYGVGRKVGDWWKWKVDPYTVDAVLLYAQRGHGRRASLYSDYTFAVWENENLVPFAKAYSGLTDEEIRQVDAFVKRNTRERFGPVRSVKPELVFELAFEGIQESPRHKSGIAVRFPRMSRWRKDKKAEDADTLERVRALLKVDGSNR